MINILETNNSETLEFFVSFENENNFEVQFENETIISDSDIPIFDGKYDYDSLNVLQEIECSNHVMSKNVTIQPIKVSKVINQSGGNTVTIGG